MATIVLDKVLTYKEWGLHKNIIAALGPGNTGIGKALTTLETEFRKVIWVGLDPVLASAMTPRVLHAHRAAHQANFTKAVAVGAAAGQVFAAAAKAETTLKTSKMVPDASKKYVTQIKDAAHKLQLEVNGLNAQWDEEANKIRTKMHGHHQTVVGYIAEMQKVSEAAKKGDAQAVHEFWDNFTNAVPFIRGLGHMGGSPAAVDEVWKSYLGEHVFPLYVEPADQPNVSTWVDAVLKALTGFAAIMQTE